MLAIRVIPCLDVNAGRVVKGIRFKDLKERAIKIDEEAQIKLETFKESLNLKLEDRDRLLSEFEREKAGKIANLRNQKESIEQLFTRIKEIIQIKEATCLSEAQELIKWALNDNQSELFWGFRVLIF